MAAHLFELTFVARLSPLAISIFQVKKPKTLIKSRLAKKAIIYCKNCSDASKLFEINQIQVKKFTGVHILLKKFSIGIYNFI